MFKRAKSLLFAALWSFCALEFLDWILYTMVVWPPYYKIIDVPLWPMLETGLLLGQTAGIGWAYGFDLAFLLLFGATSAASLWWAGSFWRAVRVQSVLLAVLPIAVGIWDPYDFPRHFVNVGPALGVGWLTNQVLLGGCLSALVVATFMIERKRSKPNPP